MKTPLTLANSLTPRVAFGPRKRMRKTASRLLRVGVIWSASLHTTALMSPPVAVIVSQLSTASGNIQVAAAAGSSGAVAASVDTSLDSGAADASADTSHDGTPDRTLVQFVVVRRDLLKTLEWPVGSVIAQACHACTAVTWTCRDDADVQAYLTNLGGMHKVVKECKGEDQLRGLADKLTDEGLQFHMWVEQPENIPTAVALKPYPRVVVASLLKKYQLFK